jgi:hypothetical protein
MAYNGNGRVSSAANAESDGTGRTGSVVVAFKC